MCHLPKTIAFLALGASINIAIAEACAIWSPMEKRRQYQNWNPVPTDSPMFQLVPPSWLEPAEWEKKFYGTRANHVLYDRNRGWGVNSTQIGVLSSALRHVLHVRLLHLHNAGWPLAALQCEGRLEYKFGPVSSATTPRSPDVVWKGGATAPAALEPLKTEDFLFVQYRRPLPWRPMWMGFLTNTALYGLMTFGLSCVPGQARRWRRIRRGLCAACGYPIGSSDKCSECGKPVNCRVRSTSMKCPDA
ncbi:MAG: hypothetical protein L0219_04970, partial [Phycisphaerales bacterium]|nr:hypothetical protein [Phycisphaerales bacterium]